MKNTKVHFDSALNSVIWEINGFVSYEDFKTAGKLTHTLRMKHKTNKQVNNIKDMKVLSKEIQDWIDGTYFPEAKESGLKHFAFIVPKNTFGKLSMEKVNADASRLYEMEIEYFNNADEASRWLNSID